MISIILTTFNQQTQLLETLRTLLAQEDIEFEIIVVDKNSEDDTLLHLEALENTSDRLRHIVLPRSAHAIHKDHLATMLGIRAASWDRLILTRSGCIAPHNHWLSDLISAWDPQLPILLLPVLPESGRLTLRQRLHLFRARHGHARHTLGPILGYSKSLFMQAGGFPPTSSKTLDTLDCLVRHNSKSNNTQIITDAKHTLHRMVP